MTKRDDLLISIPTDDAPLGEGPVLEIFAGDDWYVRVQPTPGEARPLPDAVRFCTSGARRADLTLCIALLHAVARGEHRTALSRALTLWSTIANNESLFRTRPPLFRGSLWCDDCDGDLSETRCDRCEAEPYDGPAHRRIKSYWVADETDPMWDELSKIASIIEDEPSSDVEPPAPEPASGSERGPWTAQEVSDGLGALALQIEAHAQLGAKIQNLVTRLRSRMPQGTST